jgi:hypothetical protein
MQWRRSASHDHQPCNGWLVCRDSWGDRATQAVAEHEDPSGLDGRVLLEQVDSCDRVR